MTKFFHLMMSNWLISMMIIVILYVLLALAFDRIVKRYFRRLLEEIGGEVRVFPTLVSIVGVFYGILFGFVVVNQWQEFHKIQDIVNNEASSIALILLYSQVFPPNTYETIKTAVGNYVVQVRTDEWNQMRKGEDSEKAYFDLRQLLKIFQSYNPQSGVTKDFYHEILSRMTQIIEGRRVRVDVVRNTLPTPLFLILIATSMLLIFFLSIVSNIGGRHHLLLHLIISALIAFNLALAIDMSQPFSGFVQVNNWPFYQGILNEFKDPVL